MEGCENDMRTFVCPQMVPLASCLTN